MILTNCMHKFKRTPKDLPNEQFEYIPLFDDVDEIIRPANSVSKEFVVRTTANRMENLASRSRAGERFHREKCQ